jgi:phenylacetate-coenzyme A ligase PaaK-like adenylate-forming protein
MQQPFASMERFSEKSGRLLSHMQQRLSQVDSEQLAQRLKGDIYSVIVFTPRVDVLPPNTILETGLKAKRVIDNRRKE